MGYARVVGTGFTHQVLIQLHALMTPLSTPQASMTISPPIQHVTWIPPQLVAQIGYQPLTCDGKLRFDRYQSLRHEKAVQNCTIDQLSTLSPYRAKRAFHISPEPPGVVQSPLQLQTSQPVTFARAKPFTSLITGYVPP